MAVCIYHGSTRSWPPTYRPKPRLGLLCVFVHVCVRVCVYGYITACSLQARE